GYDTRALAWWSALAALLLLASRRWSDPPSIGRGIRPVNINCVYGLSDQQPQRWIPAWLWLALQIFAAPLVFYWPAHWLLQRLPPPG
ncbi:MAG TPA: hypothetical protein VHE37_13720, partial [Nevskiaceae bacterium]|nr:hypothetical protein [Nevskiaceae bacterium]